MPRHSLSRGQGGCVRVTADWGKGGVYQAPPQSAPDPSPRSAAFRDICRCWPTPGGRPGRRENGFPHGTGTSKQFFKERRNVDRK